MHVRQLTVRDIRAISELELLFDGGDCAGWHVMLGDNGTGKSTVVRALATVLMGAANAHASRQDWSTWVREGASCGHVQVQLEQHPDVDAWAGQGKTARDALVNASFTVTATPDAERDLGSVAMIEFGKERYARRTARRHAGSTPASRRRHWRDWARTPYDPMRQTCREREPHGTSPC